MKGRGQAYSDTVTPELNASAGVRKERTLGGFTRESGVGSVVSATKIPLAGASRCGGGAGAHGHRDGFAGSHHQKREYLY